MATQPLPALSAPDPWRAWQLLRLHRPALALQLSEQVLAQDPDSLSALLARVEALRQLKRLPEAEAAARTAVAQAPESAAAFYRLAQVLGQQGALYDAELAMVEAIRLHPFDPTYHGYLAQLLYLLRRPAEALARANAGLALNAQAMDCLLWSALVLEQQNQPLAADEAFHSLLQLAPNHDLVHARLGKVLLNRNEAAAADHHLSEALRQGPERAAELLPLLRQARRWRHWPAWMRRRHQRLSRTWGQRHTLGWADTGTALVLPFFLVLSWWLTRQDPLFQLTPLQVWRRRLWLWLAPVLALPPLIFLSDWLGLIDADAPLSLIQMAGMVVGGGLHFLGIHLIKKKITSSTPTLGL